MFFQGDEVGFDFGFKIFDDLAADFGVFDAAVDEFVGAGFELGFEHGEDEGVGAGEMVVDVGEDFDKGDERDVDEDDV